MAKEKHTTKGKKKPAALAADEIIESQKKAAKYVGRSERTIRRWVKEGMPTAKVDGKTVYVKSMLDYFKASEGKQVTEDRKREQVAQADLKSRQKLLIDREEVEAGRVARVLAVTKGLNAMQRRIIAAVPTGYRKQVNKILSREIKYLRKMFAGGAGSSLKS